MIPTNGKVPTMTGDAPADNNGEAAPPTKANGVSGMQQFGLDMFPFSPVPFSSMNAWARVGIYGTIAVVSWKKMKTVSYVAMGAAGVSMLTSLAAKQSS